MSDHLPECGTNDGSMFCICAALRACEQRVLDAAQEAIRNREDGEYFPWVQVEIAVAAIEALGGGR